MWRGADGDKPTPNVIEVCVCVCVSVCVCVHEVKAICRLSCGEVTPLHCPRHERPTEAGDLNNQHDEAFGRGGGQELCRVSEDSKHWHCVD